MNIPFTQNKTMVFCEEWNVVSYITNNRIIINRDKWDKLWSNLITDQSEINCPLYEFTTIKMYRKCFKVFNVLLQCVVHILCNYHAQRDIELCGNHQASWEFRGYQNYLSNSLKAEILHIKMIENTIDYLMLLTLNSY